MQEHYEKMATKLQQHEFFYFSDAKTAEIFSGAKETQSIRVYKDDSSYKFDGKIIENYWKHLNAAFGGHLALRVIGHTLTIPKNFENPNNT